MPKTARLASTAKKEAPPTNMGKLRAVQNYEVKI
jgi:hypothetical protein